jgi:carboxylesterase
MRPLCIEAFRDLGGERGGVLLVHGFTGSPHEMRPLLEPLAERGYSVLGVRLPGHGFPVEREHIARPAWEATVDGALDELLARHAGERVAICGLSMGALLALATASRRPADVGALALLSPAISLPTAATRLLGVARWLAPLRDLRVAKGVSDIRDAGALAGHPGCDPFPMSAFVAFDELRRLTRTIAHSVSQPTLIMHGERDRTCTLAGAEWLRHALGGQDVEMHVLRESGHVITVDAERQTVIEVVVDFLDRTIGAAAN